MWHLGLETPSIGLLNWELYVAPWIRNTLYRTSELGAICGTLDYRNTLYRTSELGAIYGTLEYRTST